MLSVTKQDMFANTPKTKSSISPLYMRRFFFLGLTTLFLSSPKLLLAAELSNPLDPFASGNVSVTTIIARLIQALLGITGAVALLMFIWGGFQWLISGGTPEKVKKGKETLTWAVIGLAVIIGAYMLVSTVVSALESGTIN